MLCFRSWIRGSRCCSLTLGRCGCILCRGGKICRCWGGSVGRRWMRFASSSVGVRFRLCLLRMFLLSNGSLSLLFRLLCDLSISAAFFILSQWAQYSPLQLIDRLHYWFPSYRNQNQYKAHPLRIYSFIDFHYSKLQCISNMQSCQFPSTSSLLPLRHSSNKSYYLQFYQQQ